MDVHILVLSTMSPELTRQNLEGYGYDFKLAPSIQKFRWRSLPTEGVSVCLWVLTMHPLCTTLASSLIPYMDANLLWYHDHDLLSCVRVEAGMQLLEAHATHISLMATVTPALTPKHASTVRRYYDEHGFERRRCTDTLENNVAVVLEQYLSTAKTLR